jgi:addiction module HigA family antidote
MITIKGVDPRMIANNLTPYEPTHPGELVKGEIEYRGISQRKLAEQMGVTYSVLNEILNGKHPISTEYAMLFEAALDIESKMLIDMQSDYNIQVAQKNKTLSKRLAKIREVAAVL